MRYRYATDCGVLHWKNKAAHQPLARCEGSWMTDKERGQIISYIIIIYIIYILYYIILYYILYYIILYYIILYYIILYYNILCYTGTCGTPIFYIQGFEDKINLTSPSYPNYYEPNLHCIWTIYGTGNSIIVVDILDFEMEYDFDFLSFGNGSDPYSESSIIATLTGTTKLQTLSVRQSKIWIKMLTEAYIGQKGFKLEIRQTLNISSEYKCCKPQTAHMSVFAYFRNTFSNNNQNKPKQKQNKNICLPDKRYQ